MATYDAQKRKELVELQLRDKNGRWIEMGKKARWYSKTQGKMLTGTIVGTDGQNAYMIPPLENPTHRPQPYKVSLKSLGMFNPKASLKDKNRPEGTSDAEEGYKNEMRLKFDKEMTPEERQLAQRQMNAVKDGIAGKHKNEALQIDENGKEKPLKKTAKTRNEEEVEAIELEVDDFLERIEDRLGDTDDSLTDIEADINDEDGNPLVMRAHRDEKGAPVISIYDTQGNEMETLPALKKSMSKSIAHAIYDAYGDGSEDESIDVDGDGNLDQVADGAGIDNDNDGISDDREIDLDSDGDGIPDVDDPSGDAPAGPEDDAEVPANEEPAPAAEVEEEAAPAPAPTPIGEDYTESVLPGMGKYKSKANENRKKYEKLFKSMENGSTVDDDNTDTRYMKEGNLWVDYNGEQDFELTDSEMAELFKTKPDFPYTKSVDGQDEEEHVPELPENVRRMMEKRAQQGVEQEEAAEPEQAPEDPAAEEAPTTPEAAPEAPEEAPVAEEAPVEEAPTEDFAPEAEVEEVWPETAPGDIYDQGAVKVKATDLRDGDFIFAENGRAIEAPIYGDQPFNADRSGDLLKVSNARGIRGQNTSTKDKAVGVKFTATDKDGNEQEMSLYVASPRGDRGVFVKREAPKPVEESSNEPEEAPEPSPEPEEAPTTEPLPEAEVAPETEDEPAPVADPEPTPEPAPKAHILDLLGIKRNTPEALPGEKYPPTQQQQDVIDAVLAGKHTKVQAKAGSGKTSTIEAIARRLKRDDPKKRALYIAFNKSVQTEAEGRMPDNVEARTGHSLAHGWATGAKNGLVEKFKDKDSLRNPNEIGAHLGVKLFSKRFRDGSEDSLSVKEQVAAAMKIVGKYAYSADDKITAEHFDDKENHKSWSPETIDHLVDVANDVWADLMDPNGKVHTSLDVIRKAWALSRPDLSKTTSGAKHNSDIVFIDEAQDTPPVLAKIVADQNHQRVVVGDADQAIYSFTGATDYLSKAEADVELPLNKSWRFGPQIADWGNRFLQLVGSKERVVGGGPESEIVDDIDAPDAILTRSNSGMIGHIVEELEKGRTVGVPKNTKSDLQTLLNHANALEKGWDVTKPHDDLAKFKTWDEFKDEAEEGRDPKLTMFKNLFDRYGISNLRGIMDNVVEEGEGWGGVKETIREDGIAISGNTYAIKDQIKSLRPRWEAATKSWVFKGTQAEARAKIDQLKEMIGAPKAPDVTVSTAHKSKGLEWGKVKIGNDFPQPSKDDQGETVFPDDEELRLAYVAVTRAEKVLAPGSLAYVLDHTEENGGDPAAAESEPAPEDLKDRVKKATEEVEDEERRDDPEEIEPTETSPDDEDIVPEEFNDGDEAPSEEISDTEPTTDPEESNDAPTGESDPSEGEPEPTEGGDVSDDSVHPVGTEFSQGPMKYRKLGDNQWGIFFGDTDTGGRLTDDAIHEMFGAPENGASEGDSTSEDSSEDGTSEPTDEVAPEPVEEPEDSSSEPETDPEPVEPEPEPEPEPEEEVAPEPEPVEEEDSTPAEDFSYGDLNDAQKAAWDELDKAPTGAKFTTTDGENFTKQSNGKLSDGEEEFEKADFALTYWDYDNDKPAYTADAAPEKEEVPETKPETKPKPKPLSDEGKVKGKKRKTVRTDNRGAFHYEDGTLMAVGDIVLYKLGRTGGDTYRTSVPAWHEMEVIGFNNSGDAILIPTVDMEYTTFTDNKALPHYETREDFINKVARKGGDIHANPGRMMGVGDSTIYTGKNPSSDFKGIGGDLTENPEGGRTLTYGQEGYTADGKLPSKGDKVKFRHRDYNGYETVFEGTVSQNPNRQAQSVMVDAVDEDGNPFRAHPSLVYTVMDDYKAEPPRPADYSTGENLPPVAEGFVLKNRRIQRVVQEQGSTEPTPEPVDDSLDDAVPSEEPQPDEYWGEETEPEVDPDSVPLSEMEKGMKYSVYYSRLMDRMEQRGVVSNANGTYEFTDPQGAIDFLTEQDDLLGQEEARFGDTWGQNTKDKREQFGKAVSDLLDRAFEAERDSDEEGDSGNGGTDPDPIDPDDSTPFGEVDEEDDAPEPETDPEPVEPEPAPEEEEAPEPQPFPEESPVSGKSWNLPTLGSGSDFDENTRPIGEIEALEFIDSLNEHAKTLPVGTKITLKMGGWGGEQKIHTHPTKGLVNIAGFPIEQMYTARGISRSPLNRLEISPDHTALDPIGVQEFSDFRATKRLSDRLYGIKDLPAGSVITYKYSNNTSRSFMKRYGFGVELIDLLDPAATVSDADLFNSMGTIKSVTVKKPKNLAEINSYKDRALFKGADAREFGTYAEAIGATVSLGDRGEATYENGSWTLSDGSSITRDAILDKAREFGDISVTNVDDESKSSTVLGAPVSTVFSYLPGGSKQSRHIKRLSTGKYLVASGQGLDGDPIYWQGHSAMELSESEVISSIFGGPRSWNNHAKSYDYTGKSVLSNPEYNKLGDYADLDVDGIKKAINDQITFDPFSGLLKDEAKKLPIGTKIFGSDGSFSKIMDGETYRYYRASGTPMGNVKDLEYMFGQMGRTPIDRIELPSERLVVEGIPFVGTSDPVTNDDLDKMISAPRDIYNFDNMSMEDIAGFFHEKFGDDFLITNSTNSFGFGGVGENRKALARMAELMEKFPWLRGISQIAVDDAKNTPYDGVAVGVDHKERVNRTTKPIGVHLPNGPSNRRVELASAGSRNVSQVHPDVRDLVREKATGGMAAFFANETNGYTYTAEHEFGHLVDAHRFGGNTKEDLKSWLFEYLGEDEYSNITPKQMISKILDKNPDISTYGWFYSSAVTSGRAFMGAQWWDQYETLAESFADVEQNKEKANEVSKFLYKKMLADSQRRSRFLVKYGRYPSGPEDRRKLASEFPMPEISV